MRRSERRILQYFRRCATCSYRCRRRRVSGAVSRHTLTTSSSFCGGACVLFRPRSAAHDCGCSPAADKKGEKGEKGALPPVGTIGPQQFVIKLKQENVMFEVRQPLVRKYPGSRDIFEPAAACPHSCQESCSTYRMAHWIEPGVRTGFHAAGRARVLQLR